MSILQVANLSNYKKRNKWHNLFFNQITMYKKKRNKWHNLSNNHVFTLASFRHQKCIKNLQHENIVYK